MDRPSEVNLSSTDASVSNIPTATPIASEIISDFEPDPKFEITPLEKATFDCNDLSLEDNNLSELVQHSENGDQGENEAQKSEIEQVSQDSGVHNALNEYEDKTAEAQSQVNLKSKTRATDDSKTLSTNIRGHIDRDLLTTSKDIPKINDCPSSFDKNENDADHLTATISLDESIAATALVEVAERADALGSQNTKNSDHIRQQYSAITASQQTGQIHSNEGSDTTNYLFSTSQTSVDALRDKVIESALELGEAHDFSHAPMHVEDKEKLYESIHREVTGIQSSIDLIADVASQQQSIEINPVEPQKQAQQDILAEPSPNRSAQEQSRNLIAEEQLASPSKIDVNAPKLKLGREEANQEVTDVISTEQKAEIVATENIKDKVTAKPDGDIVSETVDASEVDQEPTIEIPELQIEPIIEEPPIEISEPQLKPIIEDPPIDISKPQIEPIIEEPPIEIPESQIEPIIEEPPATSDIVDSDVHEEQGSGEPEEVLEDIIVKKRVKQPLARTEPEPIEEPVGQSRRSLRVRAPKRKLEEETSEPEQPKKQVKRSRLSNDQLNKSTAPVRGASIIKLPALKSRMTISTSDPSSRPGAHRERAAMASPATDKKYVCEECGFATDRLANIVYHHRKNSVCPGKSAMAEKMKNDIIKQQQSKGKRRQAR